jgi:integrase
MTRSPKTARRRAFRSGQGAIGPVDVTGARRATGLRRRVTSTVSPRSTRAMTRFRFCWSSRTDTDVFAMFDILYDKSSRVKSLRAVRGHLRSVGVPAAPLSRFGVRYILAKYCTQAREAMPTLAAKRLHPHSMRHSTAVHLLRSGVDMVTISQWLGHASVTTTSRYATVDLEMKRKAIESARRPMDATDPGIASWRRDASILQWLEPL